MAQTALEWLIEGLRMQTSLYTKNEIIEIAKEMEKKQIIMAFYEGQKYSDNKIKVFAFGENYYKEKFKKIKVMTAVEKARGLVYKYLNIRWDIDTNAAIQCALIAVDEILDFDEMHYLDREYWQEVKQELEKL